MKRSITRWTTAMAAAAVMAMPATGLAQTQPPTQPPTTTDPGQTTQPPSSQRGVDEEVAKQHLTAARNTLSELTQLPAAAQLTGEARTHVSQLISNFNEMITTDAQWRAAYDKLEANLNALLGPRASGATPPATGTPGAVGTSGVADLDPEIRAKLVEFRNHLERFERSAAGEAAQPGAMTDPGAAAQAAAGQTAHPAAPGHAHQESGPMKHEELLRHVAAIEAILGIQAAASMASGTTAPDPRSTTTSSTTGTTTGTTPPSTTTGAVGTSGTIPSIVTLDHAQLEQLRSHLSELRRLLNQR